MGVRKEIGIQIRTMRKSRAMTQEDLAKAIGQSPSSITMYETGRREPDFETLEALADVFNVPLASFFSGDQDEKSDPGLFPDEHVLLDTYRALPQEGKQYIQKQLIFASMEYGGKSEDLSRHG